MDERKELSPFITRNLVLLTSFSNKNEDEEDNNDQIVGFLDLISRFTYSDIDLKLINFSSHEEQNKINAEEKVLTKEKEEEEDAILISRWIFGYSIISIETNVKNGHSTIVIRKPSGITILKIKPDPIMLPEYINSFHYSSSHVNATTEDLNLSTLKEYFFTPDFFVSEFYNNDLITRSGNNINEHDDIKPTLLCGNDQIVRGINNLDRIPIIEFHKAGIIYIGPNQSKELDILSNTVGSKNYLKFLNKLGYKIDLLNNTENYTGGLDIGSNATDGKFTYFWNDKINQMVFHIITLMPNNFANDEFLYNKKRHVGNNYVNIYYDESGLPFNFNVIKSQFNFINIVISPIVVSSSPYLENNIEETDTKRYYKVKVYRKKLIPAIFSACHFKIISEDKLSIFIRNLVLVCNQFSNVWNISEGKYVSNWSRRVKHIKKLRNLNEKEREKEKGKDNSV
ncbi:hypothetical protein PACTADRAFT_49612 [Pachysolen tannophilus NRRL Y-2460]|uniref:Rap-GAP domain-containing protein n=1 Tax=Pachysolen tannophilus NRRL Y-2460 TaxID=669874 RepID=A0A1E4TWW3_PACTA|nr:hypothetical protein PACTADRAFT_49612 [Pachysolen tannophilus NRRL Y-2460]